MSPGPAVLNNYNSLSFKFKYKSFHKNTEDYKYYTT